MEEELRKEIEQLISYDDWYSDTIRDIYYDCEELDLCVPKVVMDVCVIDLFESWEFEYKSCKTIDELKSLKEKIQNHFDEVYKNWQELEEKINQRG